MYLNYKLRVLLLCVINFNCSLLVRSWQMDFNRNFLCKLGKILRAQELIWFLSEQLNTTNSVGTQDLISSVSECLGITQTILSNHPAKRFIQTGNKKNAMSVVLTTSPTDPILQVHDLSLHGRRFYFGLLIMVNVVHDFNVVPEYLIGLSERSLRNTLLYFYSVNRTNELFGITAYPELKFENRSNYFEYLKNEMSKVIAGAVDMQGYKLYTPLRQDMPQVFSYVNANGKTVWQGSTYNVLKLFTNYCNGTLISYAMPKDRLGGDEIDMKAALELIRKREVSVIASAYALFQTDEKLSNSYPLMVVRWCLMVPIWNSVTTLYYLTKPFDELTWLGITCVFGTLVLTKFLWLCLQGSQQLAARLSNGVLHCFCLSTGITTPRIIRAPPVVHFLICATIFFYGFFLTANYTSLLGSIFTVTLFRAQINTMDDLVRLNLSVMIIDYELDFLRSNGHELPENFSRLIMPVDVATFSKHQLQLNSSFAYFVTEEKWHFLNLQQLFLKQGIFKFTDICFGSYHLTYPLQPDSLIYRNLEYYIYRMHSSGMLSHYERNAFDYATHAGHVKRLTDITEFTSAGMQHLFVIFCILLAIFCVSIFVFVVELLIYRVNRKQNLAKL